MAPMSHVPGPPPASFDSAVTQLENTERELAALADEVSVRLQATRAALKSLKVVRGPVAAPAAPFVPPRGLRAAAPAKVSASDQVVTDDKVRAFLKDGPVSPARFQSHFRISAWVSRRLLAGLVGRGVVHVSGATGGRRIALTGGKPAKEAP